MFKLILSLMLNRANAKEWQIQIAAYLLKKAVFSDIKLGEVLSVKKMGHKSYKRKEIVGVAYNLKTKKITALTEEISFKTNK